MGIGWYLTFSRRLQTVCSSSEAVTFPRAKAQLSGAAMHEEKMPEKTLSESLHSSKKLCFGQHRFALETR